MIWSQDAHTPDHWVPSPPPLFPARGQACLLAMRIIKATPYPPVETQVRTLPGASSRPPNWMLWVNSAQAKLGHFCNKMLWDEHVFMVFWQLFKFRDVSINQSRDGETRALDTEAYHSFGEMRNQADTALLALEQLRAKCLRCKSMRLEVTCIFLQFRKPTYHGRAYQWSDRVLPPPTWATGFHRESECRR